MPPLQRTTIRRTSQPTDRRLWWPDYRHGARAMAATTRRRSRSQKLAPSYQREGCTVNGLAVVTSQGGGAEPASGVMGVLLPRQPIPQRSELYIGT